MGKYDRLLFILNLIRGRRNLNASMIARECGVTERTVYRDIMTLSEANIPVYYDRGYKLASDSFLPPLNFTVDEYLVLKTALESSPLNRGGPSRHTIRAITSKIEASLSSRVRRDRLGHQPVSVSIKSTAVPDSGTAYYAAIERGIRTHRVVRIAYRSLAGETLTRDVEPLFMIFIERAFYFVAYCRLRGAMRTFRLDRVQSVTVMSARFKPRAVDPDAYFADSWGVCHGEPVEVELVFSGKAARVIGSGRHHPGERKTELSGGRIRYRVKVSGTDEIGRWILSFGGEVTVVRPDRLRRELVDHAQKMIKNHGG